MTHDQFTKNLALLASYLQLAHLQAEILQTHPQLRQRARKRIKGISERAKLDCGSVCFEAQMDKDAILEMAGTIDDIVRPSVERVETDTPKSDEGLHCCCDNPNSFKEMEQGKENCSQCEKAY